jgi:ligand-binding sensor domain-containing protein/signal transduction histidine kinase
VRRRRPAIQTRCSGALLLCLLAGLPAHAGAATLPVRTIGTSQGLSQSSVNAILCDSTGYMWFATQDGLNRYDGYTMTVYRHEAADSTSLPDNFLWRLAPATDGGFWIGTFKGGLGYCGPGHDGFHSYAHEPGDSSSLSENNVTAIHQDRDRTLWVGTWFGGLNRLDPPGQGAPGTRPAFGHYRAQRDDSSTLSDNRVSAIVRDSAGTLWVGTWRGLNRLEERTGRFRRFLHDPEDPESLSGDAIWAMTVDPRGRVWIATWGNGLSMLDPATLRFTSYRHDPNDSLSISSNLLRALHVDPDGSVWVGTYGAGVNRLDPHSGKCERFRHDPFDPTSLPSDEIQSLYRDPRGMLWIGTAAGVANHDRHRSKVRIFRHSPSQRGTLSHNHITAVHIDPEGGLWVGTHGSGLNYRAPGSSFFRVFRHDPDDPFSLSSDLITSILRQRDGTLWVGTRGGGLNRRRPMAEHFDHIYHDHSDPGSISADDIQTILETSTGELWVGTNGNGLNRYDREHRSWVRYSHRPSDTTSVSGHHIWALSQDSSGTLWAGTWGEGLNRFDPASGAFLRYRGSPSAPLITILSIAPGGTEGLWLGTSDGLACLNTRTGNVSPAPTDNTLPSSIIYSILREPGGTLWLGTARGLVRFQPSDGSVHCYDTDDGLPGIEFMHGAAAAAPDGWMYFGGIDGLTAFHPDSIAENRSPPRVVITRVTVADREIPLTPSPLPAITLSHEEDFFTIEFAALDFVAPEHNQYAFMMEGADREWVSTGTRRHVSYSHLGSGTYLFRVRGANSDGAWNTTGASLSITITPPFWQTLWFRAAGAALVIGVLALLYRYRINKLLELERMRIRIASDLHDEVGSSLTKIALYTDLLKDQGGTDGGLVPKIGALSRETVTTMSDIVWSIDARNDTVADLLDRMREVGHGLLEPRQIEFELHTEGLEPGRRLPVDLRENLYLIFKEAITNAAKYSGASRVHVTLEQHAGQLSLVVEDNGCGFSAPARPQGQGLRNMELRARRIGAHLTIAGEGGVRITMTRRAF